MQTKDLKLPVSVKFNRVCEEWDEYSCPTVVDADGKFFAGVPQFVNHPGQRDEKALATAFAIRDAINSQHEQELEKKRLFEETKKFGYDNVVRLYDENGNHIVSVLRCHDCKFDFDIATPDGVVVCCAPISDFWPVVLMERFPWGKLKE